MRASLAFSLRCLLCVLLPQACSSRAPIVPRGLSPRPFPLRACVRRRVWARGLDRAVRWHRVVAGCLLIPSCIGYRSLAMASSDPSASPTTRAVVFDLDGVLLDLGSGAREPSGLPRLLPGADRLLRHLECSRVPAGLAALSGGPTAAAALASLPAELTRRFGAVQQPQRSKGDGSGVGEEGSLAALVEALLSGSAEAVDSPSSVLVLAGSPEAATVALKYGARAALLPRAPPRRGSEGKRADRASPAPSVGPLASDARLLERAFPLPSLLALSAETHGLPPFRDQVLGCTPVSPPWFLDGTIVRGFGRGSATLGIPTANLDPHAVGARLADAVTGVYAGWARVDQVAETNAGTGEKAEGAANGGGDDDDQTGSSRGSSKNASSPFGAVLPACLSIGYNPTFGNSEKTCEPWILADFPHDFYGARLRLAIVSYIRPELRFDSLQALIDGIHRDADVTRSLLGDAKDPHAAAVQNDPFFK